MRDLAEALIDRGHQVSVLAPADEDTVLPDYVVACRPGDSRSLQRIRGPAVLRAGRIRTGPQVDRREASFDVIHIHEPATPSLSLLALWAADGPLVGTFHSSNARSRAMTAAAGLLAPALERLSARIAVSEDARVHAGAASRR